MKPFHVPTLSGGEYRYSGGPNCERILTGGGEVTVLSGLNGVLNAEQRSSTTTRTPACARAVLVYSGPGFPQAHR